MSILYRDFFYQNLLQNFLHFGPKSNFPQKWVPPLDSLIPNYIFNIVKIYFQYQPTEPRYHWSLQDFSGKGKPRPLKGYQVPLAGGQGDSSPQDDNEVDNCKTNQSIRKRNQIPFQILKKSINNTNF